MSRSWQESRRHGGSDHQTDLYAGPEEYMEVGSRGFLVNTLLGKEEVGIDDAIDLLRQATIKLYGGIKPRTKKFETSDGFVKIDFMDPEAVVVLPHPEGELIEEPTEEPQADDAGQEKQNGSSKDEQAEEAVAAEGGATDEEKKAEGEAEGEKMDEGSSEKEDKDKKKNGDGESKGEEKKGESKHDVQWMQSSYKFKTYRTEIRNMMFIKSDVPDPVLVADAAMEIVIGRKSVTGDAVRQLLPVLGVCPYDCYQLEVMTRCTLSPMFDESLEPKGFSVFLMDKLSDPGSDLLIETIRNTIWSINPLSWQASPLIEPDVVIRLEIIGKKLVLSCLSHFMRYRHYNPKLLLEVRVGEPEDDDGSWVPADVRKMQEMIRADRERKRELERKRDEEYRKEREKRRAEAEARRQERQKEREREEKERRLQREKERERRRMEEKKDDKGSHEKKEDKGSEKEQKKDEEKKKQESATDKEKTEESPATEQKTEEKVEEQKEEKKGRTRKAANAESPPSKKAKVEEAVAPPEEEEGAEKEETMEMEESEEGAEEEPKDKKAAAKKGAAKPSKRGGRRKGKK